MQSHKGVGNIWIRTIVYCNGWYTLCTVHAEKVLYQLALHELATISYKFRLNSCSLLYIVYGQHVNV